MAKGLPEGSPFFHFYNCNSSARAIRKAALTRFPPLRGYLWNKAERRFLLIIGRSLSQE
ncbi:MAG: hypothetical protein Q4C65_12870 [Eubacteriales bacterium]|nr:hypothetical protein [Eubacteriales bacterium]